MASAILDLAHPTEALKSGSRSLLNEPAFMGLGPSCSAHGVGIFVAPGVPDPPLSALYG